MANRPARLFQNLAIDGNNKPIQVGGSFVTADATGTPVTSPLSLTTTAVFTIIVPAGATKVSVMSAADVKVSDVSDVSKYDLIKANTKETLDVANMDKFYVANASSGTNNFYFKFTIV